MGIYYWFADFINKRYIDGYAAKEQEWRGSAFDQAMIVNYMINNMYPMKVKFVADERGEWDEIRNAGFVDYTCDVILQMFNNDYFNEYTKIIWLNRVDWIFRKFKSMNRLNEYLQMAYKIEPFMEHYKQGICDSLNNGRKNKENISRCRQ